MFGMLGRALGGMMGGGGGNPSMQGGPQFGNPSMSGGPQGMRTRPQFGGQLGQGGSFQSPQDRMGGIGPSGGMMGNMMGMGGMRPSAPMMGQNPAPMWSGPQPEGQMGQGMMQSPQQGLGPNLGMLQQLMQRRQQMGMGQGMGMRGQEMY